MKISFVFLVLLSSFTASARNPFVDSLNQKVEVKKKSRWTLADWLDTKKQVGLMDAWLAANTSANLFEFYLGANYADITSETTTTTSLTEVKTHASTYDLAGFVSIFGLAFNYQTWDKDTTYQGEVLLRLLGKAEQSTRLNLFYGLRKIDKEGFSKAYDFPYFGAELRLYLLSFLAIQGRYMQFQESEMPNSVKVDALETSYGLAIDVSALQLSAEKRVSTEKFSSGEKTQHDVWQYGIKLYF
ncbi:MAG: hypothetical protein KDD40_00480 [Bdellovibrionales bacterium]|nr:hypothetical protein [Bdellovibrionales bacterium]